MPLPGGDFPLEKYDTLKKNLIRKYPFLDAVWADRLFRAYGTLVGDILGNAQSTGDLGQNFGWNLTEKEVLWLIENEWAQTADDILWRRTKAGLHFSQQQYSNLAKWLLDQ